MSDVRELILRHRVVVIYRGVAPSACLAVSEALHEAGLRAFEVTFNSEGALDAIGLLRDHLPPDAAVGAGTVVAADQVRAAAAAGAQFVISPNIDEDVVGHTLDAGMVSIPGAQTATEVLRAYEAGADIVKVFPVRPLGGAEYIRQLRGPIGDVPFLASGGVDAALALDCFDAGCESVGVGLHLFGVDPAASSEPAEIVRAGCRFMASAGLASSTT